MKNSWFESFLNEKSSQVGAHFFLKKRPGVVLQLDRDFSIARETALHKRSRDTILQLKNLDEIVENFDKKEVFRDECFERVGPLETVLD